MKFIFDEAVEGRNPEYRFYCTYKITKQKDGILLQNKVFKDQESYLRGLEQLLLCMGISDYQYKILEPKSPGKSSTDLEFYFKSEIDHLQLMALISDNKDGYYKRNIQSLTKGQSEIREMNILKFMRDNEIKGRTHRRTDEEFDLITSKLFDYLAVSVHYLKGHCDTKPEKIGLLPERTVK